MDKKIKGLKLESIKESICCFHSMVEQLKFLKVHRKMEFRYMFRNQTTQLMSIGKLCLLLEKRMVSLLNHFVENALMYLRVELLKILPLFNGTIMAIVIKFGTSIQLDLRKNECIEKLNLLYFLRY